MSLTVFQQAAQAPMEAKALELNTEYTIPNIGHMYMQHAICGRVTSIFTSLIFTDTTIRSAPLASQEY